MYFNKKIYEIEPYTPGEQPKKKDKVIKLNTNENPYPPSPKINSVVSKILKDGDLKKYPNPISQDLVNEIAKQNKLSSDQIIVTNGSDEGLSLLFRATLDKKDKIVIPYPTYSLYPVLTDLLMNDSICVKIPLTKDYHFDFNKLIRNDCKMLAFAYPNAPTGILENKADIIRLIKNFKGIVLCDEAYIDFAPNGSSLIDQIGYYENLIVSRTFSKSYSLAGLRVGYLAGDKNLISMLYKLKDSYNVGMLEQSIALTSLKDQSYFKKNIKKIITSREWLIQKLNTLGFKSLKSDSNFIFTKPPENVEPLSLFNYLKDNKIFIRYFKDEVSKQFLRISVGTDKEHNVLVKKIMEYFKK